MKRIVDTGLKTATGFVTDFKGFLLKHNFVSMAVGVVIGAAVGDVVKALVADWITPFIAAVKGSSAELGWVWELRGQKFLVGHFVGQVINFTIVAFVIFMIMRAFLKAPPPPPTKECLLCTEAIPVAAKRCKFCTADQPAAVTGG